MLATENRHKGEEISAILREGVRAEIRTLADFPKVKLPPETGLTYQENAARKAEFVAKATGHWALGDDTGLEVLALGGAPGLYSARFAGDGASFADNRSKLLDLLKEAPDEKRGARFVCVVAIARPNGWVDVVEGRCDGMIARTAAGSGGFGYDPIFFIPVYDKTFAELSPAEKNKISHRGCAVRAAMEILKNNHA